jgi:hypothetical protein
MEPRDRSFGGKAGIWLKKRKHRVHPNAADVPLEQHKKVTPQSVDNNTLVAKNDREDEAQLTRKATNLTVIGWDDERCRPIYKETSPASTSSGDEGDDEAMETTKEARDDSSDRDEGSDKDNDCSVVVPSVLMQARGDNESRKTRAYGSRKRKANSLSSHHDTKPKRQHVPKKETVACASMLTPSMNRTTFDLATPQTALGSICAALNSDTKATPLDSLVVSDGNALSDKATKPTKEKKGPNFAVKRKKKNASAKQQHAALPSLATLDFTDENVSQPSSNTSLAAARAFFERLDAQQTLTLDSSGTPLAQGKKCVRTRRAITTQSDSLREEYEQYASATKATGVEPLSLEQYAVNRSAFFRTGDMYDGFLDG